jgi:hypothetical protein
MVRSGPRLWLHAGLAALLMLPAWASQGQAQVEEYPLKAAFIFNFARYVAWPEAAADRGSPFVFGVLGEDPFVRDLDEAVAGGVIHGRPAVVRRFERVEDARQANVLYLRLRDRASLERALVQLAHSPVLTVGDGEGFLEAGGMIELSVEGRRLRFDVNLPAARSAGLAPSSQLLKLARSVKGGPNVR